ncbi:MAG TPA: hypothetical protein V6D48_10375 [Oculatellaceae cyanobacterium]
MEKMNRLGKPVNVLAVLAIATTGIITPAIAGNHITISQGTLKLAQRSLAGQCRAAKVQIPVYRSADTTSEALRLLAPDEQVTLADNSVQPSGFIGISTPIVGFVQAVNLQSCNSSSGTVSTPTTGAIAVPTPDASPSPATSPSPTASPATSTSKELCRRVARPTQGLLIRRGPNVRSPLVGKVAYLAQVTLTTNPPKTRRADQRDWVEISSPVQGWVSNRLLTEPQSNLEFCQ